MIWSYLMYDAVEQIKSLVKHSTFGFKLYLHPLFFFIFCASICQKVPSKWNQQFMRYSQVTADKTNKIHEEFTSMQLAIFFKINIQDKRLIFLIMSHVVTTRSDLWNIKIVLSDKATYESFFADWAVIVESFFTVVKFSNFTCCNCRFKICKNINLIQNKSLNC